MNRQQRRNAGQKQLDEKVITIKISELEEIKKRAVMEGLDKAFLMMFCIPMTVLHDKMGYGKKRLIQFANHVVDIYEAYDKNNVSLEELWEVLGEECRVDVNLNERWGRNVIK